MNYKQLENKNSAFCNISILLLTFCSPGEQIFMSDTWHCSSFGKYKLLDSQASFVCFNLKIKIKIIHRYKILSVC